MACDILKQIPHVEGGEIFRHLIFWTQLHLNRKKETWRMTQPKGISPNQSDDLRMGLIEIPHWIGRGVDFLGQSQQFLSYMTKYLGSSPSSRIPVTTRMT